MPFFGRRAVVQVEDRRLEGLRVAFDVARNLSSQPNSAEVRVWNLAEDTRRAIAQRVGVRVLVLAGYRDEAPHLVFAGSLRRVEVRREGPDVVTVVSSGDGAPASARVSLSLAQGADVGQALGQLVDLAQGRGLGAGNAREQVRALRGRRVGAGGLALSGPLDRALDALLAQAGVEWSVQDGQLQLLERGTARQVRAAVLSSDSGLVDSPEVQEDGRLRARSLIAPGLSPGLLVRIEAQLVRGFYRVDSCRYVGDTEGPEWYADLELRPVQAG